jgi:hypothetical protein
MRLPRASFCEFAAEQYLSEFSKFVVRPTWVGKTGPAALYTPEGEWVKSWRVSSELISVEATVKTNVLGFRDKFSGGIQRCISSDQAYDKLSVKKDDEIV